MVVTLANDLFTAVMKIIDPHLHFFALEQGDYFWLKAEKPPFWPDKQRIAKNFCEQDLILNNGFELAGFVHIEAGFNNNQPWREIAFVESKHLQQNNSLPFRCVAFVDILLSKTEFKQQLKNLQQYHSVVGCRYILDDLAVEILSNATVVNNLAQLAALNFLFEVQMSLTDSLAIAALKEVLRVIPTLKIIINHAGIPPLNKTAHHCWLNGLEQLSLFQNCALKCSGWEMVSRNYSLVWIKTIVQHCLAIFGDHRVMLASNFPLCSLSKSYQQLWQSYQQLELSKQQYQLVCYLNASRWYQLAVAG